MVYSGLLGGLGLDASPSITVLHPTSLGLLYLSGKDILNRFFFFFLVLYCVSMLQYVFYCERYLSKAPTYKWLKFNVLKNV